MPRKQRQQLLNFTPPRKPRPAPVAFTRQPALSSNLIDRISAGEFEGDPAAVPPAPERYFCPPEFDYPGWDAEVPY